LTIVIINDNIHLKVGDKTMFGDKLKEARKKENLTLDELAEKYNKTYGGKLSKGTLSKYENGKQEPMFTVVSRLATILNVSIDTLCEFELIELYTPEETKLIEAVKKQWGFDAFTLLELFSTLNDVGKDKAIDALSDLSALEKYTSK
jgi:transcriptional regulator with XRE-family HTH domain